MHLQPWEIVITIGALILVYSMLLIKPDSKRDNGGMIKEIEETIENFALEMEEDNRELLKLFADMKSDYERQSSTLLHRIEFLEQRGNPSNGTLVPRETKQFTELLPVVKPVDGTAVEAGVEEQAALEPVVQPFQISIRGRYKGLFELYEQGKSVDYIAKRLGMNKGEIQLIIQLSKQEEQAHV